MHSVDEYEGTVLLVSHDGASPREVEPWVWCLEGSRLVDLHGSFVEWEALRLDKAGQRARIAEQEAETRNLAESANA